MHDQGVWNPTAKQLAAEESREAESYELEIEGDSAEEGDRAEKESFASADSEANRERIATGAEAKPHLE